MLGYGLGGFAQGVERGVGLGERMHRQKRQREQEQAFDAATEQGKADFDGAVAAGKAKPGNPDDIMRYALPRMVAPLLKAGDVKGAEAARSWAEADTNRRASRLFGEGMIAGQAGDMKGAITRFVEAGRTRGYGGDFQISDPEPIEGGGWRVRVGDGKGQESVQEFRTPDDVLRFGSTWLNPEAAFQQWQAQRAELAKRQGAVADSLTVERGKAEIGLGRRREEKADDRQDTILRQKAGLGNKQSDVIRARQQAVKELEAAGQIGTLARDPPTPEASRRLIEQRAREILGRESGAGNAGTATPSRPGVIVDTRTGRRVDQPAAGAAPAQRGGATPSQAAPAAAPAAAAPRPAPAASPTAPASAPRREEDMPGVAYPRAPHNMVRSMFGLPPTRQDVPPPAAGPAAPEPSAAGEAPEGEKTVRQSLEGHEEYRALQQQLSRFPRNSPEGARLRERMREIESEVRDSR